MIRALPSPVLLTGTGSQSQLSDPRVARQPGRLRVLLATSSIHRGGAEEHMLGLLRGLDRREFELYLACPDELRGQLSDLAPDVELIRGAPQSAWHWRDGRRLAAAIRKRGIDIVHFHLASSSRAGAIWARRAGVRVVLETPHLREAWRRGWKRQYWPDRMFDRCLDAYIAVSAANAAYLRNEKGLHPDKIWTIPNGVDLTRFRRRTTSGTDPRAGFGIAPGEMVILCVARLEPQKGHAVLLSAFSALAHAAGPQLRLVCLGEGGLLATLRQQAAQLGIAERVIFAGHSATVETWLATADLFVLPSLYEGLPLAAIEASAAGCPVVATAVDGTPEVVSHGHSGLLVPPGDANALASAMQRLLADPALRLRMGENARVQAAHFDLERQVAATAHLYIALNRIHIGQQPPLAVAAPTRRTA